MLHITHTPSVSIPVSVKPKSDINSSQLTFYPVQRETSEAAAVRLNASNLQGRISLS